MATRPTANTPRFSTSGTNTEPSSGKKAAGWAVNERVPAQWLNWLQWSGGEWIDYFARALFGEAVTDIAINAANPSATIPVIDVTTSADTASATYKLLFRFAITSTRRVALYVGASTNSRRFVLVQNASWNGSQWAPELTTAPATAIALRGSTTNEVIELLYHAASASAWADNAWSAGAFTALNTTTLHVTGTGPGVTATFDGPVTITGTGQLTANGIVCDNITDTGFLTVAGTSTFNGPAVFKNNPVRIQADYDIIYDEFAPDPQPERQRILPLCEGVIISNTSFYNCYNIINGYLYAGATDDLVLEYPLEVLPRGCIEWSIEALWQAPDSAHANSITVFCAERDHDLASSAPSIFRVVTTLPQATYNATFATTSKLPAPITTEAISPEIRTYFLRVFIKANAALTNRLYSLRVVFNDPGARNG
jgi:hypothetical protein